LSLSATVARDGEKQLMAKTAFGTEQYILGQFVTENLT
jgi:hypothetical protein